MYDGLGRVVGHSSNGFATSYAYTPMGTLGTRSVTSGTISVSGSYSYEETDEVDEEIHPLTGRISGYTSTVKNGSTVKSSTGYTYTYDGAGNITEIRIGGVLKYKYTYDKLGQLTREDNAEAGKSYTYTYDDGGNILSKRTNVDRYIATGIGLLDCNMYAYCHNNPIMYIDPTGHFAISAIIIGALIGGVIGFGSTAIVDYTDDGKIFNGSVSTTGYIANTIIGAMIGGLTGGVGSSTFTITYPTLNLATSSIGTSAVVMGTSTITIEGTKVVVGVGILGGLIVFNRIGKSGGYRIDHHYPNDHDPIHVHISGDDGITRVDLNGNPIQNDRPMTPREKKAFWRLIKEIYEALKPWI